ncbi:3-mercaptopyruvate sulfurtransferase, putative [Globisporangium polare]
MAAAFSSHAPSSPLLTTEQVQSLLASDSDRRVRFLDASWYLDKSRNGKLEFGVERLPGAAFFDIEDVSDKTSSLPHMLPTPEAFESAMAQLGVSNDDTVVVYVGKNCFSAARCWWTLKYFGHENVHVMNGGINKWKSEDREVATGTPKPPATSADYKAHPRPELVVSWEQVLAKLHGETQIGDARGAGRFHAKDPEPRPGMRGGHIPGAVNVPFGKLVSPDDYSVFRDVSEIKTAFAEASVEMDATSPVITSCGSGVTACVLTFGLHLLGKPLDKAPVYDGSWSEWGMRDDLPLET